MECAPWDDLYFVVNLSLFLSKMPRIVDFSLDLEISESTEASAQLLESNCKRSGLIRTGSGQRGRELYALVPPRQLFSKKSFQETVTRENLRLPT
jgi:hypothetical protein